MKLFKDKDDKKAWHRVTSNICGNLAAGWFGIVLITAVFDLFVDKVTSVGYIIYVAFI